MMEAHAYSVSESLQTAIDLERKQRQISNIQILVTLVRTIDPWIFKLGPDGEPILNKRGKPKINWSVVLTNLTRIIGALIAIRNNLPANRI
jgi:hypothetical protein